MHSFQAFESNEKLSIPSYFNLPRDLLEQECYSPLSPDAILLYGIFLDRLAVSYLHNNDKIHFFNEDGKMYIIFKRDEIMKKMHIKRTKLDSAIKLLESCNLIKQVQQGRNLPNIIYVGKTKSMIESAKIINIRTAEKQHSGMSNSSTPECRNSTPQYNYNNINNHNKNYRADNRFYDESNQYNNLEKYYYNFNN